jgi:PEP-CTERM motif
MFSAIRCGDRLRIGLPATLVLLTAAAPALADDHSGDSAFGTCMTASLVPGGPWGGGGPFDGYECGDGFPAYAWTVTTPDLFAFGATNAATATVRSHASTWAAATLGNAGMAVTSWDTLTFAADGDITVRWRFDGEVSVQPRPGWGQQPSVSVKLDFGPEFGWTYYNYDDPDPYHAGRYDIQGAVTLHVTAGEPFVVYQFLQTNADGPGVDVDFSHTGRLVFELPPQQSFTSASGVFLTGAVPEPATALTLGLGMALIGGWRCRQRPAPAS